MASAEKTPWFLQAIHKVLSASLSPIQPTTFIFQPTIHAAEHNMQIIKSHGRLEATITAQHNSPISYGSEFRTTSILQPLMHRRPIWEKTFHILNNGTTFPLTQINDTIRHKDLLAALEYKNHKSAHPSTSSLEKHISTEIEHGLSLPLPPNFTLELEDAEIAPHGMVKQNTITELGEIVEKERVTHDQSYPGQYSKESINSRVIEEELSECLLATRPIE